MIFVDDKEMSCVAHCIHTVDEANQFVEVGNVAMYAVHQNNTFELAA